MGKTTPRLGENVVKDINASSANGIRQKRKSGFVLGGLRGEERRERDMLANDKT